MKIIHLDAMNALIRDEQPDLQFLQKYVGGHIEVVHLDDGGQLIVNEEGKLQGMPINPHATLVNQCMGYGDYIVGRALHLYDDAKIT